MVFSFRFWWLCISKHTEGVPMAQLFATGIYTTIWTLPVLLLSGYFLTRHSRRHMLSLLREAFPGVPVVCDYFLGRTPENQAGMACLFQHLPSALYETEFSGIFIRVSA